MKTLAILISTLFLLSFTSANFDKGPEYVIPKDTKKAAMLINEAFSREFKAMKYIVQPKAIKFAGVKDLSSLISSNPNISKEHRYQILNDLEEWRNLRATVIELYYDAFCAGKEHYIFIVEGGSTENQTHRVQLLTTCGKLRCMLTNKEPLEELDCSLTTGPVQNIKLCRNIGSRCCIEYYCFEEACPKDQCSDSSDCHNCY